MHVYMIESVNGKLICASEAIARDWLEMWGWKVEVDNSNDDNLLIARDMNGWGRIVVMGHVRKMPVKGFVSL